VVVSKITEKITRIQREKATLTRQAIECRLYYANLNLSSQSDKVHAMPIQLNADDRPFEIFLDYLEETHPQPIEQALIMQRPRGSKRSNGIISRKLPNCIFKLEIAWIALQNRDFSEFLRLITEERTSIIDAIITSNLSPSYMLLSFLNRMSVAAKIKIEAHHAQLLDAIYNLANGGRLGRRICGNTLRQQAELKDLNETQIQQALNGLESLGCILLEGNDIILQEQIIVEHTDLHP